MRKFVIAALLAAFVGSMLLGAAPAKSQHDKEAIAAAKVWLTLVDDGQYAASWNESAELFRSSIPKHRWVEAVGAVRDPIGEVKTRELKSATYATSLPGAPDGAYVVIQFRTTFENKKAAIETITPMRQTDGTWRVSGYYIR